MDTLFRNQHEVHTSGIVWISCNFRIQLEMYIHTRHTFFYENMYLHVFIIEGLEGISSLTRSL